MEKDIIKLDKTKDGVRKYWNSYSVFYDTAPGYGANEEKLVWKRLLADAIGPGPKKVLDAGTGTGFISIILAELGYDVSGIDFSDGMMKFARDKTKEKGLNIDFIVGDVENLEFDDGIFDCVTARYVLWTLPHPEKALKEWMRIVRPGGKIIVVDGKWTSKKMRVRISKTNYSIYRYIKSGKNPLTDNYKKDVNLGLPNPHGIEKEDILRCFAKAGLTNINVQNLNIIREIQRKQLPWYMKYANEHPIFWIEGIVTKDCFKTKLNQEETLKKGIYSG